MKTLAFVLLALLAGCASAPSPYARYAECQIPVTRDAGMGVRVPGCVAWTFGPNREQKARWDREHK